MNKTLIRVLLLCMILTCMTSGTLAIYTTEIDDVGVTAISAKRFYIGVNSASEFSLSIAPGGESVRSDFTIQNYDVNDTPTEVNMDLTISADFTELYQTFPGIKAHLIEDGNPGLNWYADDQGYFSYEEDNAFIADEAQSRSFHMVFVWEDTGESVTYSHQSVSGITMFVTGTQHID